MASKTALEQFKLNARGHREALQRARTEQLREEAAWALQKVHQTPEQTQDKPASAKVETNAP